MKTQKTNIQNNPKFFENNHNVIFSWVFSANGTVYQSHEENEYKNYLDMNYISKSNQEL
jgi:hypothetical protein